MIIEILSGIINLYYTSLLSKIEFYLRRMFCKDLSKQCISELYCNLAFSTFNANCLLKLYGIPNEILVRRKKLGYNTNYYKSKYLKEFK